MSMLARYKRPGGFIQLLSLIETSSPVKREKFLEIIRAENEAWADAIEKHCISLERIFSWKDETVSEIFKGLPVRNLACALQGFTPENSQRVMNYMSHSEKRKVEDEIGSLNANPDEFNGTVIKILEITRKMISEGRVRLEKVDPEIEIPEDFEEKLERLATPEPTLRAHTAPVASAPSIAPTASHSSHPSADVLQLQRVAQVLTKENKSLREENRVLKEKLEQIKKIA